LDVAADVRRERADLTQEVLVAHPEHVQVELPPLAERGPVASCDDPAVGRDVDRLLGDLRDRLLDAPNALVEVAAGERPVRLLRPGVAILADDAEANLGLD